eukprot:CAMPEP_0113905572 /NCGR_PEP_ID=MMETSP0780_2-20120614/24120_1 /TAXON_ID=652834 /ORGANISM="Palpitomonas bilix" /LENGTH=470 /DNA_ID=CAMNT_0000899783 /DNA_START=63 /DNA_END=1475 /DNA_ORIENTATION=+ /assembly_acc=CAM_ASM_000599
MEAAKVVCRYAEMEELKQYFTVEADDPLPPLYIYGPRSSGKTTIVKHVLEECNAIFAYLNMAEWHSEKGVLTGIVRQLLFRYFEGHGEEKEGREGKGGEEDEREAQVRDQLAVLDRECENFPQFFRSLKRICRLAYPKKQVFLVFDAFEIAEEKMTTAEMFSLFRIDQNVNNEKVSTVFLSQRPFILLHNGLAHLRPPIKMKFRSYTKEETVSILVAHRPPTSTEVHYRLFASHVLTATFRACRDIVDLLRICRRLYPIFTGVSGASEGEKGDIERYRRLEPYLVNALPDLYAEDLFQKGTNERLHIEFESALPVSLRFAVVAAYLASVCSPTMDKHQFVHDGAAVSRGRRKRTRADADEEDAERRPQTFSFERWSIIFRAIQDQSSLLHTSFVLDESEEKEEDNAGDDTELPPITQICLSQLTQLVRLKYLDTSSEDLSQRRYRFAADENLVRAIAQSIHVDLNKYTPV